MLLLVVKNSPQLCSKFRATISSHLMSSTEHLFLVSLHLFCIIENILSTYPVEDGRLHLIYNRRQTACWGSHGFGRQASTWHLSPYAVFFFAQSCHSYINGCQLIIQLIYVYVEPAECSSYLTFLLLTVHQKKKKSPFLVRRDRERTANCRLKNWITSLHMWWQCWETPENLLLQCLKERRYDA